MASLTLCACTPLPMPIYFPGDNTKARANLDESAVASLRTGISTRESVLHALGQPGDSAPDGRWFSYTSWFSEGEWRVIYGGIGSYRIIHETGERIRYRTLLVHFDAQGRVRELVQDAGACVVPCAELLPGRSRETQLAQAQAKALIGPDEAIREGFVSAAWRTQQRWISGAAMVTSRALLFLELSDAGPLLYRQVLRLDAADIVSVESIDSQDQAIDSATVRITGAGGSQEEFAFKPLPAQAPYDAPPFDRSRAQRFTETVHLLKPRATGP